MTYYADGFDDALVGLWEDKAVYDSDACIEILVNQHGMDYEEAEEYFEFNVASAFVGPLTPIFLRRDAYDSD